MKVEDVTKVKGAVAAFAAIANDKDMVELILETYTEYRADIIPVVQIAKDTIGSDLDKVVDEILKWGARKAFVAYMAYREAGFSKAEAMQLTLNMKENVAEAVRHVKK